ncbi:hypothetical protein CHH28_06990 [Bacterioplanes sanyensis]|uniref:Calcium-dependent cell adhesion molecule N-terminal domain-containing protein n=1 Tax=Bacterioplanes sanyensis TaxID=1249553 RepID=A0A222FIF1_9GAMM|nr:peptidase inhibitor family I36 protein [Bacterioplanes sanyensis]ASP38432.1 hypothetical protein CHH28_06990 [Bacterioplanes sanyensis]
MVRITSLALLASVILATSAQAEDKVCFYQDAEYRGTEWCYGVEQVSWVGSAVNDKTSSIKTYGNAYVDIFEHSQYRGQQARIMANTYRMDDLNDGISSFTVGVRDSNDFACLFEHPGFRGTPHCLQAGQQQTDLDRVALGRNKASSVMVIGDAAVDVFQYPNLRTDKAHSRLRRSSSNLEVRPGGWLEDDIDSMRVVREARDGGEIAIDILDALNAKAPVNQANVLTSHNAYNSTAYFSGQLIPGPNQRRALVEQLQLGIRSMELDIRAANGWTKVCHSVDCNTNNVTSLRRMLGEIDSWLKGADDNDVVFIYLEDGIDGDTAGYQRLQQDIAWLGDIVYTPGSCQSQPQLSMQQLLANGQRIFFYKDGGNSGCESLPQVLINFESSVAVADINVYESFFSATRFRRAYECDNYFCNNTLTADEALIALENGLNAVGMDMLEEQNLDGAGQRLNRQLWAIDPQDTQQAYAEGRSARMTFFGTRYLALSWDEARPYACRNHAGDWQVTQTTGTLDLGMQACDSEYPGYVFDTPLSAYEAKKLRQVMTSGSDIHVNFGVEQGRWQAGKWGELSAR